MIDLKDKTNVYMYIDTSQLDINENILIQTSQIYTFKYRINGSTWTTDTTTGLASRFRVYNNAFQIVLKNGLVVTINEGDIVEIVMSKILTISPSDYLTNNDNYVYIANHSIIDSIELIFYQYTNEKNLVTKSTYLTSTLIEYGQFTEEVDKLNPSFIIQMESFEYNYFFIPQFSRYYFVTGITSVRKGLWRVNGHVDVLYTFDYDIRKQYGFIIRNEKNPYGIILPDERVSFFAKPKYTFKNVSGGTLANTTLNINQSATSICAVISVLNENARIGYSNVLAPLNSGLNNFEAGDYSNPIAYNYAITPANISSLALTISQQQTLSSFVFGLWVYPFNFSLSDGNIYSNLTGNVTIGTTDTGVLAHLMAYDLSPYLVIADFELPSYSSFVDIEPYKECNLYIPFCSNIYKFDLQRCAGHRILVYYSVQFSNGNATANIYDYTAQQMLLTMPVQLGTQLSVSVTNATEIEIQRKYAQWGIIGNSLDTVAKMIMNGIAKNYIGMVRNSQEWIANCVKAVWNDTLLQDTATLDITSANLSLYNPMNVYLITKEREVNMADNQTFETRNGYPINTWDLLSRTGYEYTGYTEVTQLHYRPSIHDWITSPEIDEIETLAKNGIIL